MAAPLSSPEAHLPLDPADPQAREFALQVKNWEAGRLADLFVALHHITARLAQTEDWEQDIPPVMGILGKGLAARSAAVYRAAGSSFPCMGHWPSEKKPAPFPGEKALEDSSGYCLPIPVHSRTWGWLVVKPGRVSGETKGGYHPLEQGVLRTLASLLGSAIERTRDMETAIRSRILASTAALAKDLAHQGTDVLAALVLGIDQLGQDPGLSPESRNILGDFRFLEERAQDLLQDIRGLGECKPVSVSTVDVGALLKNTASMATDHSPITVDPHLDPRLWRVRGDRNQLSHAFRHLIENAIEALGEEGTILVIATHISSDEVHGYRDLPPGEYVKIDLVDTGPGIPRNQQVKVFAPFFSTWNRTGLGLTLALAYIRTHRGHLELSSEPDEPTVFTVFLPAVPPDRVLSPTPPTQDLERLGKKILLVEDDEIMRNRLKRALEYAGCQLQETTRGEQALPLYQQAHTQGEPFDVVLMDRVLEDGGTRGLQAARAIRALDPAAPIILVTGHPCDPRDDALGEGDFAGVIQKPFHLDALLGMIQEVTEDGATG